MSLGPARNPDDLVFPPPRAFTLDELRMTSRPPLPHVPFDLFGFLKIVGFLLDRQHRFEALDREYARAMDAVRW